MREAPKTPCQFTEEPADIIISEVLTRDCDPHKKNAYRTIREEPFPKLQAIEESVQVKAKLRRSKKKHKNIYELVIHQCSQLFSEYTYKGKPCK